MIPDLTELLRRTREAYPDAEEMAPGVSAPEAHVAAWHAVVVQGGASSPQREAWRLSADRGFTHRSLLSDEPALAGAMGPETNVDTQLVNTVLRPDEAASVLSQALDRMNLAPVPAPVRVETTAHPEVPMGPNGRGEFYADGKLWHHAEQESPFVSTKHEGAWLTCDGCNPIVVVELTDDPAKLRDLRAEYAEASKLAKAAEERFKAAKGKLQTALAEASGGAYRAALVVPGYKPVNLTYSEPWTLDTKRLKAEQPGLYVEYAVQGHRWTLAESRSKS